MGTLPAFDWDIDLALGPETSDLEPERDEGGSDEEREEREESEEGYDEGLQGSALGSL
ncbi:hypothetical protein HRbin12_00955 [bacterium HR12]|nr:hypothetical protein HRbin12_00955 [bacterium HR12]